MITLKGNIPGAYACNSLFITLYSVVLMQQVNYCCLCQILEKKLEYNRTLHQLFVDFKKTYDSDRREVLYNILIEFGIPMKLKRLIKIRLSETYSSVRVGKAFV